MGLGVESESSLGSGSGISEFVGCSGVGEFVNGDGNDK